MKTVLAIVGGIVPLITMPASQAAAPAPSSKAATQSK